MTVTSSNIKHTQFSKQLKHFVTILLKMMSWNQSQN